MGEIASIISTVLTVITVLVIIHILGLTALGLKKSWKRSVITIGRSVTAILLAFITAKLISAPLSGVFGSLIGSSLAEGMEGMPTLVGFVSGIPGALVIPFLFVIFFWIYYLLLLIPQIFVKKAVLKDEIAAKKEKKKIEIPWKSRFISAGIKLANAVIILLIVMLPLSCLLAVVDDAYVAIEQLMEAPAPEEGDYTEDYPDASEPFDVYEEVLSPITENPIIAASSNPLARVIYSNLTEIRVGDTVCYLDQEILGICDVLENVTALTEVEFTEFGEDQKLAIKGIAAYVSESEFRCNLICELMSTLGGEMQPDEEDFMSSITGIIMNPDPETIGDDLTALADIVGVLIDHDMFSALSEEGGEPDPNAIFEKFAGKEFLEDLLTAVNPSQKCRNILPAVLNLAFSSLSDETTATTVTDVPELTPEQITAEAATISELFNSFMEFTDSSSGSDNATDSISGLDMAAFGKIYDKSQESIILKDNFKAIFLALLNSDAFEGLGDVADILANHIENDPNLNMTKVLTALQQLSNIFGNYSGGNEATDMVAFKNDLSALINSVDASTAQILNEILESDTFASTSLAGGENNKSTKLLTSVINSMVEMENLSEEELEQEAKALDYLLKISNSKSESVSSVFEGEGDNADEMMDSILNSNISVTAINELAYDENGNLTGDALEMSESLTEEDKQNVNESAEKYYKENVGSMTAEEKELLKKNMNAIGAIFGTDYSSNFSDWDAEIAG